MRALGNIPNRHFIKGVIYLQFRLCFYACFNMLFSHYGEQRWYKGEINHLPPIYCTVYWFESQTLHVCSALRFFPGSNLIWKKRTKSFSVGLCHYQYFYEISFLLERFIGNEKCKHTGHVHVGLQSERYQKNVHNF